MAMRRRLSRKTPPEDALVSRPLQTGKRSLLSPGAELELQTSSPAKRQRAQPASLDPGSIDTPLKPLAASIPGVEFGFAPVECASIAAALGAVDVASAAAPSTTMEPALAEEVHAKPSSDFPLAFGFTTDSAQRCPGEASSASLAPNTTNSVMAVAAETFISTSSSVGMPVLIPVEFSFSASSTDKPEVPTLPEGGQIIGQATQAGPMEMEQTRTRQPAGDFPVEFGVVPVCPVASSATVGVFYTSASPHRLAHNISGALPITHAVAVASPTSPPINTPPAALCQSCSTGFEAYSVKEVARPRIAAASPSSCTKPPCFDASFAKDVLRPRAAAVKQVPRQAPRQNVGRPHARSATGLQTERSMAIESLLPKTPQPMAIEALLPEGPSLIETLLPGRKAARTPAVGNETARSKHAAISHSGKSSASAKGSAKPLGVRWA